MAVRGRPRSRKILTVVFDTNSVFNNEFDALVCGAACDLIRRHSHHGDLGIRWVIPDIVRGEREYQMRDEYRAVSSNFAKAERLFGPQWGITQDVVNQRISESISTELAQLRIEVVPCAIERVDWNDMMRRSVFREPPFERGQTEKGFRDAILCETFLQLASEITGGDTIMLVSNDRMVKKYIDSCAIPDNKARVVDGLDALNDEIQLRVANVDEITQAFIELRARLLFCNFEKADDPHTLWVKERIHWQVWHKYGDRLKFAPAGVTYVLLGQELSDARLTKKEGQRVYFETTLWIRSAYRMWIPAPNVRRDTPGTTLAALGNSPALEGLPKLSDQSPPSTLSGLLGLHTQAGEWKEIEKATKDEISIRWSATFTKHRTLTRASIDAIELVDLPSGIGAFNRGVSGGS